MTTHEITLTKALKIYPEWGMKMTSPNSKRATASLNKNLESLGFCLSERAIRYFIDLEEAHICDLYHKILPILRKMVGAHVRYTPMYPNFPKQVMEASEAELYLNAVMHYLGSAIQDGTGLQVRIMPVYEKQVRPSLPKNEVQLKVLDLADHDILQVIFNNIVSSNGSVSDSDKDIVRYLIKEYKGDTDIPDSIPNKENLAFLISVLAENNIPLSKVADKIKTATDVLRIASAMSGGDVSLAKPAKFRRFKRAERRFLLECLNNSHNTTEDMLRYAEMWKRLGRELRPGDYSSAYPKAHAAFDVIRNDKPFETFNGRVEYFIGNGQIASASGILSGRPGDFARRLDKILRESNVPNAKNRIKEFKAVADKVSTPVLMQMYAHFGNRNVIENRVFMPKGQVAKLQLVAGKPESLDESVRMLAFQTVEKALLKRFSKLDKMGKVYIDDSLMGQNIPFAMRSASKALKTVARGSKIDLPSGNIIRMFLWWKDGDSRTDVDLSAGAYDKDFNFKTAISYYNLRDLGGYHSGDITSAPKGAAEFIDININGFLAQGIRYVVMCSNLFTMQKYKDLPECFAGVMARNAAGSGEIFDARTVLNKFDLTADNTVAMPLIIDLQERKIIWADLSLDSKHHINNYHKNSRQISDMLKGILNLNKPNLYDLFHLHVLARGGKIVSDKEKADVVYSMDGDVTPFDTNKILAEYMQ